MCQSIHRSTWNIKKQGIATPPNGHSSATTKFKDAKIVKIPDDFKSMTLIIKSSIWMKKINMKEIFSSKFKYK